MVQKLQVETEQLSLQCMHTFWEGTNEWKKQYTSYFPQEGFKNWRYCLASGHEQKSLRSEIEQLYTWWVALSIWCNMGEKDLVFNFWTFKLLLGAIMSNAQNNDAL